jgi:pyruvate/2-oxoglutarate dehydrogenase complex dihydrolipoamide dehydrogenase (E3) component
VLEATSPLSRDDADCAEIVLEQLAREELRLHTGVEDRRVNRARGKVQVIIANGAGEETIEGSRSLLATGRRPNIDDHALDAAGIKNGRAGITVDKRLRTTKRRVYAIGDVVGARFSPMRRTITPASLSAAPCFACLRRLTTVRCPGLRTSTPSLPNPG